MASEDTRFKPGQSGNPGGATKEQRAQQRAVKEKALEHCLEALQKHVDLMRNSPDERIQQASANSILDRGLGKPAQALIGGDEDEAPLQLAGVLKLVKPAEKA